MKEQIEEIYGDGLEYDFTSIPDQLVVTREV